jgi:hypothetical protein
VTRSISAGVSSPVYSVTPPLIVSKGSRIAPMRCAFDQFAQSLETDHRLVDAHVGQDQQELVTAEAADHVEFAQALAQQLADPASTRGPHGRVRLA